MVKIKKKSGKNLRKSGKSQGKIRKFDWINKVGTLKNVLFPCDLRAKISSGGFVWRISWSVLGASIAVFSIV